MKDTLERHSLVLEVARSVRPAVLVSHAVNLGWRPVPNKRADIAVFHRPDSELHQVIIPTDLNLDDFAETVVEAVRKLADSEGRFPVAVLIKLAVQSAAMADQEK